MSSSDTSLPEPRLAPDFARRVLDQVDLRRARRRHIRRASVGVAVSSLCAVAIVAGLRLNAPVTPDTPADPVYREAAELQDFAAPGRDGGPEALGDLFPDAAAVASFDTSFAQTNSDADVLFEDETQDDRDFL